MLLSTEDLKSMIDDVSDMPASRISLEAGDNSTEAGFRRSLAGQGTVNLETFLVIMEKSAW